MTTSTTNSCASLSSKVRMMYETLGDWQGSEPLVSQRRRPKEGKFCTPRLRAVQSFALSVGGAGLSNRELGSLYNLLKAWDTGHAAGVIDGRSTSLVLHFLPFHLLDARCATRWMQLSVRKAGERLG